MPLRPHKRVLQTHNYTLTGTLTRKPHACLYKKYREILHQIIQAIITFSLYPKYLCVRKVSSCICTRSKHSIQCVYTNDNPKRTLLPTSTEFLCMWSCRPLLLRTESQTPKSMCERTRLFVFTPGTAIDRPSPAKCGNFLAAVCGAVAAGESTVATQ